MTIWRKSTRSGSTTTQSDCVEVAELKGAVGLRDSKAPDTGHLTLSPAGFAELVTRVKRRDFDL